MLAEKNYTNVSIAIETDNIKNVEMIQQNIQTNLFNEFCKTIETQTISHFYNEIETMTDVLVKNENGTMTIITTLIVK